MRNLKVRAAFSLKCCACGTLCEGERDLAWHIRGRRDCLQYYFSNYRLFKIGELRIFPELLYVEKIPAVQGKKWKLFGVTGQGKIVVILPRASIAECRRIIEEANEKG